MTKRALSAVAGFLGLCLTLSAESTESLEPLQFDGSTLPSVTLADRDVFSFSTAFGWTPRRSDYLPSFSPMDPRGVYYPTMLSRRDPLDHVVMRSPERVYYGGELGVLYGRSDGKYGREDFQTYIIGTVGNEKFSITAGYLHHESSGRGPYRRR